MTRARQVLHLIQPMQNGVELLLYTIELRRRRLRECRCDTRQRSAGSKSNEAKMQHRTPIRSMGLPATG